MSGSCGLIGATTIGASGLGCGGATGIETTGATGRGGSGFTGSALTMGAGLGLATGCVPPTTGAAASAIAFESSAVAMISATISGR
jgi:hypothetical protein